MEYKTYPCEVKFKYLVRRKLSVVAVFFCEKDGPDYAMAIGGSVVKAAEPPAMPEGSRNFLTVRKRPSGNGFPMASQYAALLKNSEAPQAVFKK